MAKKKPAAVPKEEQIAAYRKAQREHRDTTVNLEYEKRRKKTMGEQLAELYDDVRFNIVMPVPLVLQYLFDINGIPYGSVIQLTGDRGNRKTTFAFELGNQVATLGGKTSVYLTEGKFSHSLAKSYMGYEHEHPGGQLPYSVFASTNTQEWQIQFTTAVKQTLDCISKGFTFDGVKYPPGCYNPYLFVVDSLVAQLSEAQAKTIEQQGGQERGYATNVKAISDWLTDLQSRLTFKPLIACIINHCTIEDAGMFAKPVIKEKGGRKVAYYSSLIVVLNQFRPQKVFDGADGYSLEKVITPLKLSLNKSSIGDSTREIVVQIEERNQVIAGRTYQRSRFLWGKALVNLLMQSMYAGDMPGEIIALGQNVFDLASARNYFRKGIFDVVEFKRISNDVYGCDKYATEPGQTFSAEQLGTLLQKDAEFVDAFQRLFSIKLYPTWSGDCDYVPYFRSLKQSFELQHAAVVPTVPLIRTSESSAVESLELEGGD